MNKKSSLLQGFLICRCNKITFGDLDLGGGLNRKSLHSLRSSGHFLFREFQASLNSLHKKSPALRAKLFLLSG